MGMSLSTISNTLGNSLQTQETAVQASVDNINAKGGDASTTDLLALQQESQKWTMLVELNSTMIKQFGDAAKGVIQKMN